ncbi:MAG: hypothetical protein WC071_09900 [Victivallaceae bacterium]
MQLTGHPIIDIGLAVACNISHKKSVTELSEKDLQTASQWFLSEIEQLEKRHIFSSYWQNNPFMGKNITSKTKYKRELALMVNSTVDSTSHACQTCGKSKSFIPLSRTWFPLGGSASTDPCTYPNLEGKHLCLSCCRANVLATMGCRFASGKPFLIHVNDPELIIASANSAFNAIKMALTAGGENNISDNAVSKGHLGLFEILTNSPLWNPLLTGGFNRIPKDGATVIQFSNSGTAAYFYQLILPARILEFFTNINASGISKEFVDIIRWSSKNDNPSILHTIETGKSIAPLLFYKLDKSKQPTLSEKEITLMKVYESVAINKQERFEVIQGFAKRVCDMDKPHFDSFTKQLANIKKRETLLDLLTKFSKSSSINLTISNDVLKMFYIEPTTEIAKMLYLLCIAESNKKN